MSATDLRQAKARLDAKRRTQGIPSGRSNTVEPDTSKGNGSATAEGVGEPQADDAEGPLFRGAASGAGVDLVEPGEYSMIFVKAEQRIVFNRSVVFAHFSITDGPHAGKVLPRFYNTPPKAGRLARSSSIFQDFAAVTGLRPPWKGFRLRDFLADCVVRARVVTVNEKPSKGGRAHMPSELHYSKVDRLISLESGIPPFLRSRLRPSGS